MDMDKDSDGYTRYTENETCCCGCSLECGVNTFGVLSVITFIIAIIAFILVCTLGAAISSGYADIADLTKRAENMAKENTNATPE